VVRSNAIIVVVRASFKGAAAANAAETAKFRQQPSLADSAGPANGQNAGFTGN
jgi:hypothetical protein